MPLENPAAKETALAGLLNDAGSVAVAFSGGVDSTFLLKFAHDRLGDRAVAVTLRSAVIPARELERAIRFCRDEGIRQIIVDADVMVIPHFSENPPDRCYHCKKYLFEKVVEVSHGAKITFIADGSNADDDDDYRPGRRALKELGIRSPLKECGFTKADIRILSKGLGLPTWDKPSMACLASRFPYGMEITSDGLRKVELAEDYLRELGFTQYRVRAHGQVARIEVPESQIELLMQPTNRCNIVTKLKNLGFAYVTADLLGFRSGSLNETINTSQNEV